MNRDKCLAYRQSQIDEAIRQKNLVETLPLNQVILLTCRVWRKSGNTWENSKVAAIALNWNYTSIRCDIIAVEFEDVHPYYLDIQKLQDMGPNDVLLPNFGRHALKFIYIKNWEPIDPYYYPLLIGYGLKYPRLEQILKTA